jgi:hypothetical protein
MGGLDLTKDSLTFPYLPEPQIRRDDLVRWLRDKFRPELKVILVQGLDGAGKTTLLAQFAKAYPDRCFSFFVGADPWASSSRQFLLEMCAQMHKVVGSKDTQVDDSLTKDELKQLFETFYRRAAKRARKQGRPFYFVVDGLDWVTEGYGEQSILDLLPTALPDGIYLLASSAPEQQFRFIHDPWEIPFFSPTETEVYLMDIGLKKEQAKRVYDACEGMPGYLAQIRREIQSGLPIDEVLTNLPKGFCYLLEREWDRAQTDKEHILDALAVLAYTETPLHLAQLAQVIDAKLEELEIGLASVPLVEFDSKDRLIRFVTDAHKRFVVHKLSARRGQAEAMLIKYYEQDPLSDSALIQLPILYKKTERYDSLKHLVSVEYLTRTLQQEQDVSLLRRNARLIADAAYEAEDWQTLLQYSLAGSIFRTLSMRSVAEAEIEALLALGDYQQSLEMAYQAVLPEDRLQLLAKVGSHLKQQELPIPAGVLSDLEHMAAEIKPAGALLERVIEIAADLFYVHHQATIDLIEKVAGTNAEGQLMDVILAVLSLRLKDETGSAEMLRSRISDQSLREFARVNSPVVAELTPEQVLKEASEIDDISAKLFLLRSWCNANRDNPAAIRVIHEALEIMTSTDYPLSMRHLRQFAEPLLVCEGDEVYRAVERLDLLKDAAIERPAEELTRLELLLASIEAHESLDKATNRLYETYSDLDNISELDTRCYGLARILLSLPSIAPTDHSLQTRIEQRLINEYQTLLEGSAEHLVLTRRLLGALTNYKPDMVVEFASKLNTIERRDMAYREILRVYADREPETIDLGFVETVLAKISDSGRREWTLVRILEWFARRDMFTHVPQARRFTDKIAKMYDPRDQSYAYAYSSQMMASAGQTKMAEDLANRMMEIWSTIDPKWEQVRIGFDLAAILAKHTPELARKLLEHIRVERSTTPLAEEMFAELYIGTIKLAIRAFSDILKGQDYVAHREKLIEAIRRIPSCAGQSQLLADLALRHHLAGKQPDFEQLVKEDVLKALETCEDAEARAQAVVKIAPCLFRYERKLMIDEVSRLSSSRQDIALGQVLAHLLSGRLPDDPIDLNSLNVPMEYVDACRACEVIKQMNSDSAIYSCLDRLVDALVQKDPDRPKFEICTLLEKQALRIARELAEITESKLPDPNNIQHNGYQIAAQASIARLRASAAQRIPHRAIKQWEGVVPSWQDTAQATRAIPNLADRALVMAWAGARMYRSELNLGHKLLEEAKDCIFRTPNIIDRGHRFHALAEAWKKADDKESAKMLLREAMSILEAWTWDQTRDQITGQILELAHSLDPEFAGSLTSFVDNPVIEYGLKEDLATHDLKHQPDKITIQGRDPEMPRHILGKAAWRLLKSFCSGKGYAQHDRIVGQWVHLAIDAEFDDAHRVMAWSVENSLARTKDLSSPTLSNTYHGLLDSLQLTWLIGKTLLSAEEQAKHVLGKTPALPPGLELFPVGSHAEAVAFLQRWLRENAETYLKIHDPYFTVADLDILKSISPDVRVYVLTSWKAQEGVRVGDPMVEQRYKDTWDRISDQQPPETHFYILGIKSGDSPMHDRYYITAAERGIEIGTSISGLGAKESYIRTLDPDEAAVIEAERINHLIVNPPSRFKDERLIVRTFTL